MIAATHWIGNVNWVQQMIYVLVYHAFIICAGKKFLRCCNFPKLISQPYGNVNCKFSAQHSNPLVRNNQLQ